MRVFDAFSGIGGFRLGFELEGYDIVGWSEIDKDAIQVYSTFYSDYNNYGDITKIDPEQLPDFDVFTAGIPCQPFSFSGKKKGMRDPRGYPLWVSSFKIIGYKQPKVFVIENVKGLLGTNNGNDFLFILRELHKLGYNVEWMVLNSREFGTPQNRERVYIVGHKEKPPKIFPLSNSEKIKQYKKTNVNISDELIMSILRKYSVNIIKRKGVLKQIGYIRKNSQGNRIYDPRGLSPTVTASEVGIFQLVDPFEKRIRKITPLETLRLQGFPDEMYYLMKELGLNNRRMYKLIGNAVTVPVVRSIARKIKKTFE